ncbi:MAG TPA: hypothetical protein VFV03_07870, partial [Solirubrobacteraceae bacterium]|nr:hypothetical protein [Solirubrobacteraceae bacterium]
VLAKREELMVVADRVVEMPLLQLHIANLRMQSGQLGGVPRCPIEIKGLGKSVTSLSQLASLGKRGSLTSQHLPLG